MQMSTKESGDKTFILSTGWALNTSFDHLIVFDTNTFLSLSMLENIRNLVL